MQAATPTIENTKIACLSLGGNPIARGSFPAMKTLEKSYLKQGYSPTRLHVGYAPYYRGTCICKKCYAMVTKPYLANYNGHEYYRCGICETINYVS
jgi:hypothetical protein